MSNHHHLPSEGRWRLQFGSTAIPTRMGAGQDQLPGTDPASCVIQELAVMSSVPGKGLRFLKTRNASRQCPNCLAPPHLGKSEKRGISEIMSFLTIYLKHNNR